MAEAPYHLPRPGPHSPGINYQHQGPAIQQYQQQQQPQQQQQQNFFQNSGYQYQQPNIGPTFVQPHPGPGFLSPQVNNQQQYIQQQPNAIYGSPLLRQAPIAQPLPLPIVPAAGYVQQGFPAQSQFAQGYVGQIGYSGVQGVAQSPLAYNTQHSSYSSYQADTNAYNGNQVQISPLDSTVVNRIQNILKENEHTSAKNAGYISLVSGVSLEGARPSVELSSFIHNSPLRIENRGPSLQELARGRSIQPSGGPSPGYGLPTITANNAQGAGGQAQTAVNFLPRTQTSTSYGTPN